MALNNRSTNAQPSMNNHIDALLEHAKVCSSCPIQQVNPLTQSQIYRQNAADKEAEIKKMQEELQTLKAQEAKELIREQDNALVATIEAEVLQLQSSGALIRVLKKVTEQLERVTRSIQ